MCGLAAAAPAAAHQPYGLVVDAAGNVYFSDLEAVWRLSPDGRLALFRPAVPGTHVHELALTPDGAIEGDQNRYDPATQRFSTGIWRRTAAGAERMVVPMTERPLPGLGVWQDRSGNRYTAQWLSNADRRVALIRRRPGGRVDVLFEEAPGTRRSPPPSVASVGGMTFDSAGSLFFADGAVLRRLAANGTVTELYKGGPGSNLRGLAAAPDGRVLAADIGNKEVIAIGADGTVSMLYREKGPWLPVAPALAGGRLLVLEANADPHDRHHRVRVVEVTDGRARVIASPAQPQAAQAALARSATEESHSSNWTILLLSLGASAALWAAWRFRPLWEA